MDKADMESVGTLITALAERVAIGILIEATNDDYLNELEEELDELTEAARILEMLKLPVPKLVDEVFYRHNEAFMAATKN